MALRRKLASIDLRDLNVLHSKYQRGAEAVINASNNWRRHAVIRGIAKWREHFTGDICSSVKYSLLIIVIRDRH